MVPVITLLVLDLHPDRRGMASSLQACGGSAADGLVAGVVALRLVDRPLVLIDGRLDRSPWVDPHVRDRCGQLDLRHGQAAVGWTAVGANFPGWSWRVEGPKLPEVTVTVTSRAVHGAPFHRPQGGLSRHD